MDHDDDSLQTGSYLRIHRSRSRTAAASCWAAAADRPVYVTGGSRGIGKALVRGFAERGAKVVFSGRDETSLESARKDLEEVSSEVFPERCDVSQFQEIEELVNRVHQRHGAIDVLVNVAGVNRRQRAET